MDRRSFLYAACAASVASPRLWGDEPQGRDLPDPMTFGHLRGRFVYDGDPPAPQRLQVNKDFDALGQPKLFDESLVVNTENKGLANVLLTLETTKDDAPRMKPHKSYAKTADAKVRLEYRGGRITTHVLAMRTTQKLKIINNDPVAHNCHAHCMVNPQFNVLLPAGHTMLMEFKKPSALPIPVTCAIHPWIRAYIVVNDNPYIAVTAPDGSFEIRNVPMGKWTFRLWHEKAGYLTRGSVGGKQIEWPKGRWTVDVRPGMNDLGEIKLPPQLFDG